MGFWLIGTLVGILAGLGGFLAATLGEGGLYPSLASHLILGVAIAAITTWLLKKTLGQALRGLESTLSHMHADGDLSRRVPEIKGPAARSALLFNALIESFQGIMGKVIFDAERVAAAADTLAKHARVVADGSNAQRETSGNLVERIERMTTSVNAAAEHASRTAENAQNAHDLSQEGTHTAAEASSEIERIARSVEGSAQVIAALGERSQAIGGIVSVIREIAEQTNLLALNAAIEAARAGEQGRGFAVVADEVRSLAERTATSTSEIGPMIAAIQQETQTAIASIRQGSEQADSGATLARQAADSLDHINRGAQETMERVDEIAAVITEQGRESEQVVGAVHEIMSMVERNASGAAETLQEAQELESLAANLHEISKVFKLGDTGAEAIAIHKRMPDIVQQAAAALGKTLEQALDQGHVEEHALFEPSYTPIPDTEPKKFTTGFDHLTDRLFPPIQEPILDREPALVYVIGCDRKGYVPTHNRRFAQPLTGKPAIDLIHNRTKRIFDDPVGRQCGAHELSFLIQTYRRDTGEIVHDISAPVYIRGRHWGGCRIGYRA